MSAARSRVLARLSVIAALAACGAGLNGVANASSAPLGLDVSSHQHPYGASISWPAVRASGRVFALIKATEGSSYTNPYFRSDWAGSQSAGLLHGAYHFARPSEGSAVAQADRFITVAGTAQQRGDLPPVLDLEDSGGLAPAQLITWTQAFVNEVQRLTGRKPIIYTYGQFWQDAMAGTSQFAGYPLWIASYYSAPSTTGAWPEWTLWQYSYTARIPGVSVAVDADQFNGTRRQLRILANLNAHRGNR